MLLFQSVAPPTNTAEVTINVVALPFDARQRSRLRVTIEAGPLAGSEVGIDLPRGTVMRGGTLLRATDGTVLRVDAAPESLIAVRAPGGTPLAALAYHLGNRHVPVQIAADTLYLVDDHVLAQMVEGLGGVVERVRRAFEPEGGAYSHADNASGQPHHGHGDHHHGATGDGTHHPAHAAGGGHHHAHHHGHGHASHGADGRHAPRIHDLSLGGGHS
jgi:urease accessory protein